MASQFRNSNLGYYLYSGLVILIGAASIFVFWFMISGFNIGRYPENTFIGSVYIGGLTEDEAEEKLRTRINNWLNDDRVVFEVNYQGYIYELDRELLFFDINRSINDINAGQTNELYVSFSDQVRAQILFELEQQNFMVDLTDQFDLELLLDDFALDGARMKTFSSKNLNAYILNEDNLYEIVVQSNIEAPSNINADSLYDKILTLYPNGIIPVGSRTTLSVLELFDETFTNDELSFLGSLLADVIIYTPFNIYEKHYIPEISSSYTINNYPYYGRNVLIQRSQGLDFSFENNGLCSFEIEITVSGNFFNANLVGAPLLNDVETTKTYTYVDFTTQTTTNPTLEKVGRQGVIVEVNREIYDLLGNLIQRETIITEYYPPVAEIIHTTE